MSAALAAAVPAFVTYSTILNGAAQWSLQMPTVGLGVFQSDPGITTYEAVKSALAVGYRHVDTAAYYKNEEDVARAIADSGIPRAELFLTTKIFLSQSRDPFAEASAAIRERVKKLQKAQYIDLLLIHAPFPGRLDAWRAMEDAIISDNGAHVKSIGVSNYNTHHLEELLRVARIKPSVNQYEIHPFFVRPAVSEFCQQHGIIVQAYSPLAKAQRMGDPTLVAIAEELKRTVAQVMLRWALQKGFVVLPKSTRPQRQVENLSVFDFELSPAHMARLDGLNADLCTGWNPLTWA